MAMRTEKHDINEIALEYLRQPSEEKLSQIIDAGSGLIRFYINIYGHCNIEEDLYQVGCEALIKALARFKPEAGTAFVTYASHCIMGAVRHYIRKEKSYYYPGVISDLRYKIEREIERHLKEAGEPPAIDEIAARLNVKKGSVSEAMKAGLVSWDEIDRSKISNERYESFKLPIEDRIVLEQGIKKLSDLQRKVVYFLFYKDLTQEETAKACGLNQRKVSRILHSSLLALKEMI